MVASHLHSLCHNSRLVQAIVLVKVGEGWIQIDDREMLGGLVLGAVSEHLRKVNRRSNKSRRCDLTLAN